MLWFELDLIQPNNAKTSLRIPADQVVFESITQEQANQGAVAKVLLPTMSRGPIVAHLVSRVELRDLLWAEFNELPPFLSPE